MTSTFRCPADLPSVGDFLSPGDPASGPISKGR